MQSRVLLVLMIGVAGCAPVRADDRADAEAAFAAVQAAVQARDTAALERLIEPDYRFFHGLGEVDTRAVYLMKVREGRLSRLRSAGTEHEPMLRTFGDTAVRSWIIHFHRADLNLDDWGRGSAVLVRRDGAWRLASQQTGALFWISPAPAQASLAAFAGSYGGSSAGQDRRFTITDRGRYLHIGYADGVDAYGFPAGGDVFGMGGGVTLHFERDEDGRVVRAVRRNGARVLWRAERVGS
jgi:Domain of unknown function (DUF4440)